LGVAGVVVVLLSTGPSVRAELALDFTSYSGTGYAGSPPGTYSDGIGRVIGWTFRVDSSPITITHLGFFDAGKDGLVAAHDVGVYEKLTQNLVTSVTVPAGTAAPLDSWFRMVDVPDVSLQPNTEYVIAAGWVGSTDPWVWNPDNASGITVLSGFLLSPWITGGYEGGRYVVFNSTLQFPASVDNFGGDPALTRHYFIGPNFAAVPEPGQLFACLGAVGLAGVVTYCRRSLSMGG